jgi:hypothetical protein
MTCARSAVMAPGWGFMIRCVQRDSSLYGDTIAFHTVNGVFDTDANGRDRTIGCFLRWGKFSTRGFFLRLDDRDPIARIALEPHILIQTTATGEGVAFESCQAFIIGLSFIGSTQEAKMTGLIDGEEGFDRVAFLLAAIVGICSGYV